MIRYKAFIEELSCAVDNGKRFDIIEYKEDRFVEMVAKKVDIYDHGICSMFSRAVQFRKNTKIRRDYRLI